MRFIQTVIFLAFLAVIGVFAVQNTRVITVNFLGWNLAQTHRLPGRGRLLPWNVEWLDGRGVCAKICPAGRAMTNSVYYGVRLRAGGDPGVRPPGQRRDLRTDYGSPSPDRFSSGYPGYMMF